MNERTKTLGLIHWLVWRAGAAPLFAAAMLAGAATAQESKPAAPGPVSPQGAPKTVPVQTPPTRIIPPPVKPAGTPKATPVNPAGTAPGTQPPTVVPTQPAGTPPKGTQPAGAQPNVELPAPGAPAEHAAQDGAAVANPLLTNDPEMVTLSAFSEPVQLSALVNLVATTLGINVTIIDSLDGTVAFNAAVPVKKSELLHLLDALLEQHGWTITKDDSIGWYKVHKVGDTEVNFEGDIVTTRIFSTPNLRPSAVQQAISGQLGGGGGFAGVPGQATMPGAGGGKLQPVDELGIIIATDTPRKLATIGELISKILEQWSKAQFIRLELTNIAAPTARDRVLQLLGQAPQGRGFGGDPNQAAQFQAQNRAAMGAAGAGGALDNIGDRLTVDPLSNALIFRGLQGEIDQVKSILAVIDVTGTLKPKRFFAGSSAAQIADMARQRGLGEVTTISRATDQNNPNFNQQPQFRGTQGAFGQGGGGGESLIGGPVMVVDEANGQIIYYGTDVQQEQLALLIEQLDTSAERIVIREYKLKNSDAIDVTDVINGLLYNQTPVGTSDLLGDSSSGFGGGFGGFGSEGIGGGFGGQRNAGGSRFRNNANRQRGGFANLNNQINPDAPRNTLGGATGSGDGLELDASNAFVIADVKNNQILVKAPAGVQKDFAKLIERLDLRRPQVYLECKIIAVSTSDDLRLSVETQLVNATGLGGIFQTNFGLTTAGNTITDRRNVATGLAGLTAAILKNQYVPIVINALQTKTDARILSSPSLLVDDNEEAQIATVDQEPYTTTQSSVGNNNISGFGGYAEAGTTLTIKPHISEDGYLRLQYEAELSSFTGAAANGNPPPKQTNNVSSDNITVPGDATVIVGGINIDTKRKTRIQVPLLGDLPLVGHLFQDYNRTGRNTTLYIFVTPRILREPTFADLRLLTLGPQSASRLSPDVPPLTPSVIDINTDVIDAQAAPRPPAQPTFPPALRPPPDPSAVPTSPPAPAPADATAPPSPASSAEPGSTPPQSPSETPGG